MKIVGTTDSQAQSRHVVENIDMKIVDTLNISGVVVPHSYVGGQRTTVFQRR